MDCQHDTTALDDAARELADTINTMPLPELLAEARCLGGSLVDTLGALPILGVDVAAKALVSMVSRLDAEHTHALPEAVPLGACRCHDDDRPALGELINTVTNELAAHARAHGVTVTAADEALAEDTRPGMYL